MKNILFLIAFSALIFTSCHKNTYPKYTPTFVINKIETIKTEPVRNPAAKVYSYQYHNQTVYYFPAYCCDIMSELYSEYGELICHPDGGITGSGDNQCTDFFTGRSDEELIWEDKR